MARPISSMPDTLYVKGADVTLYGARSGATKFVASRNGDTFIAKLPGSQLVKTTAAKADKLIAAGGAFKRYSKAV